jgi:hypothetical protein
MRNYLVFSLFAFLTACGGGGGSSSTSTATPSCLTSQVSGCNYSASDPTQTDYGWWNGTRTVGATTQNAYFAADSLGNFQMYIGNNFTTGYLEGTSSIQGSVLGLTTGVIGNDSLASSQYHPTLSGNNGGVITNRILSFVQSAYQTNFSNNTTTPMTMSYTYNTDGDQPLSVYAGTYANGLYSLAITSGGQITATYVNPIYIPYSNSQLCSINVGVAPTTPMKAVVINGTDTCSASVSFSLFHLTLSGVGHMVMRLPMANNTSTPAVVF